MWISSNQIRTKYILIPSHCSLKFHCTNRGTASCFCPYPSHKIHKRVPRLPCGRDGPWYPEVGVAMQPHRHGAFVLGERVQMLVQPNHVTIHQSYCHLKHIQHLKEKVMLFILRSENVCTIIRVYFSRQWAPTATCNY